MTTIFIDDDCKCHTVNDGTMTSMGIDFFDGKCAAYIDGYRFIPAGAEWTRSDGVVFHGEMIAPWKPWRELDAAQRAYERQQMADMAAELADARAALEVLGVDADE